MSNDENSGFTLRILLYLRFPASGMHNFAYFRRTRHFFLNSSFNFLIIRRHRGRIRYCKGRSGYYGNGNPIT